MNTHSNNVRSRLNYALTTLLLLLMTSVALFGCDAPQHFNDAPAAASIIRIPAPVRMR